MAANQNKKEVLVETREDTFEFEDMLRIEFISTWTEGNFSIFKGDLVRRLKVWGLPEARILEKFYELQSLENTAIFTTSKWEMVGRLRTAGLTYTDLWDLFREIILPSNHDIYLELLEEYLSKKEAEKQK